ncbi:HEAT repeat domain-containing protein [Natronoglomus mannanivorans]|uniref:HEAT repeat domain-containing protein n=1 Tax=Natronoglomus mannanivorans TaxID=2979990 RepID=A0AAP3E4V4_9EURY|nr:HEAT repeat domain-containing protein [Halobacteria archaeon AArc-xg1-1]
MTGAKIKRLQDELAADRATADDVIDGLLPLLETENTLIRGQALDCLVAAVVQSPDRTTELVDAIVECYETGRAPSTRELRSIRTLVDVRARELAPLVDYFASVLANPGSYETDARAIAELLGHIGVVAPGLVKPAVDVLIASIDDWTVEPGREAAWTLVRIGRQEPAVLRPSIAGRIWSLEDDDTRKIASALHDLGKIGWVLPDHLVEVERVVSLTDHPSASVRERAIEALGRIRARPPIDTDPFGTTSSMPTEAEVEAIAMRMDDVDSNVRLAAATAMRWISLETPDLVANHLSALETAVEDDDWRVRQYATETLERAVAEGSVPCARAEPLLRSLLADDDSDVREAAANALITCLDSESRSDRVEVRHTADLLIWHFLIHNSWYSSSSVPVDRLCTVLRDQSKVRIATGIQPCLTDDSERIRIAAIEILGQVAVADSSLRTEIRVGLESMLSDDETRVRERALEQLGRLSEHDADVASAVANAVRVQFAYDPETRETAVETITKIGTHEPTVIADAIGSLRVLLENEVSRRKEEEDEDGMSDLVREALSGPGLTPEWLVTLSKAAPAIAPTDLLIERILEREFDAIAATKALAHVVAAGEQLNTDQKSAIQHLLCEPNVDTAVQAWLSTTVVLAQSGSRGVSVARNRLHSLLERRDSSEEMAAITFLAEHRSDEGAPLIGSIPTIDVERADHSMDVARVRTADPRLSIPVRTRSLEALPDGNEPVTGISLDVIERFSEEIPHSFAAGYVLSQRLDTGTSASIASLVSAVDSVDRDVSDFDLEEWTEHPNQTVRERAITTSDRLENGRGTLPDALRVPTTDATEETIDTLAAGLGRPSVEVSRASCRRLVELASARPDLRERIVLHFLDRVAALNGSEPTSHVRTALETLAPSDSERDEPTSISTLVCRFHRSECAPIREGAAATLRPLPQGQSTTDISKTLQVLLEDDDSVVRERAARTVASVVVERDVRARRFVEPLRESLGGSSHEAIAACQALGRCAVADPSLAEEIAPVLQSHLSAPQRGVRREAANAIERLARHGPAVAARLAGPLLARIRDDEANRPALVLALASVPPEAIDDAGLATRLVAPILLETPTEDVSHAAGRILTELAKREPRLVRTHLEGIVECDGELEFFDHDQEPDEVEYTALDASLCWMFDVLASLCETYPDGADVFSDSIEATATLALEDHFADTPTEESDSVRSVSTRELYRTAATVAARGGLECYLDVLKMYSSRAWVRDIAPIDTARFLVRASPDTRTDALEIIVDDLPESERCRLVDDLVTIGRENHHTKAVITVLDQVLPMISQGDCRRQGSEFVLEAAASKDPLVRVSAIQTLAELGTTDVLSVDDVLSCLYDCLGDDDRRVRESVGDAFGLIASHTVRSPRQLVVSLRSRLSSPTVRPSTRLGCVAACTQLGIKHATARELAVQILLDRLDDPDNQVRQRAARGLDEIARVDHDIVSKVRDRLEEGSIITESSLSDQVRYHFSKRANRGE